MFQNAADVANRALQHCGVPRMDPTLGFSEGTQRANETQFAYGKIKRAELEESVWTFATRRAPLRPIDSNTMLVAPAVWGPNYTYFKGSIVSDGTGFLWQSKIPNNLGNQPNNSTGTPGSYTWEPYFGPLTAALYDSTTSYLTGEIVFTAPGDGTYNAYLSLVSGNAVDPSLPNQWSAATSYFQNQVVQQYPSWDVGTTYGQGQTVTYTDGNTYSSLTNSNTGHIPPSSGANWVLVPVLILMSQAVPATTLSTPPQTSPIIEWNSGTTYSFGSFVMFDAVAYLSIQNANTGNYPNASGSSAWVALSGGTLYMSLIDLNVNNNPANAPSLWNVSTSYSLDNTVGGSDGQIYTSLGGGNTGHDPVTDGGAHWEASGVLNPWTTVFTQGGGNSQWLQIGGSAFPAGVALTTPDIIYPLGSGPLSDDTSKNIYRLPAGYLRLADQNPKAGIVSWLGVPGNPPETDWTFEGDYIVTWESSPFVFRFVADVVDVSRWPSTFCEAFAARLGMEVCETLTQSTSKLASIQAEYGKWIGIATMKSGIEKGAVMPPLDDLIACRA